MSFFFLLFFWYCADVSWVVSHELGPVCLCRGLERLRDRSETSEHRFHVSAGLHGNYAAVVLFVHPAQSGFRVVVEDAAVLTRTRTRAAKYIDGTYDTPPSLLP